MKNMFKTGFFFIVVIIGDKAYDYPKDMPIPRIGEMVGFDDASGIVENIHYQIQSPKHKIITIRTKKD